MKIQLFDQRSRRNTIVAAVFTALAASLLSASSGASEESDWTMPRTPDGKPDLQGIWTNATQTPLQRPAQYGNRRALTEDEARERELRAQSREQRSNSPSDPNRAPPTDGNTAAAYNTFWLDRGTNVAYIDGEFRTSLIIDPPDGRIPLREDAEPNLQSQWLSQPGVGEFDGPELVTIGERCLLFYDYRSSSSSAGPPMLPLMYNNNYQIVQTPDYVMILVEMMHDARIIRINGAHDPEQMVKWMGDSVGRWEEDTLVVTTKNLHPQQSHFGSSPDVVVTERFTRESEEQIVYSVTVEDPAVYSAPWTAEIPMRARPEGEKIYEYACHEGNYALPGMLGGARREELDDL